MLYSGCQKKRCDVQTFFSTTPYAAIPLLGVFKPGALHKLARIHGYTVLLAPVKALLCLWIFPPTAEKSKPPALRVVGDPEHYYGER
jgi:hypothetical protein